MVTISDERLDDLLAVEAENERMRDAIEDQRSTIASQASALQRAAEQIERLTAEMQTKSNDRFDCQLVMDSQQLEIDRLTERCAAYKGQVEAGAHEIERLRAALERYGMHSVDCNTVMGWGHDEPCDCGFSGALNGN